PDPGKLEMVDALVKRYNSGNVLNLARQQTSHQVVAVTLHIKDLELWSIVPDSIVLAEEVRRQPTPDDSCFARCRSAWFAYRGSGKLMRPECRISLHALLKLENVLLCLFCSILWRQFVPGTIFLAKRVISVGPSKPEAVRVIWRDHRS